jgi:hypothetical protein
VKSHYLARRAVVFHFLASSALWNAEPIPPGSAESEKKNHLCDLCVSSEAGGEFMSKQL